MKTGSNLNFWDDSRLRFDSTSPNGTNSTTRGFFNGPLLAVLETCGGMLKNATRELEQRRRAPRQLFHASLMLYGTLLQQCSRRKVSSQAAVAVGREGSRIARLDQDDRIFEAQPPRELPRVAAKIDIYRHTAQPPRHGVENKPNIRYEFQKSILARHRQRRNSPSGTAVSDTAEISPSSSNQPRASRRLKPRYNTMTLKAWRDNSLNLLLQKALDGEDRDWKMQAARNRIARLPSILLQMMIRKEASQEPGQSELLNLLPSTQEWDLMLEKVQRRGHSQDDLAHYLYILEGKTDDMRCERFLERESYKPPFILHLLLRSTSRFSQLETLNCLVGYCRSFYLEALRNESDTAGTLTKKPKRPHGPESLNFVLSLLAHHCMRLDARHIVTLCDLTVQYIEALAESHLPQEKIYEAQCSVFNHSLKLLGSTYRRHPIQQALPNAFFWEAQRILLAASSKLKKQLLVDAEGFRAIRKVLAGMSKNHVEIHSSFRHAPTWPPYLQPGDGMDEEMDPEESWSRSVRAGMLMQEAGFPKEELDDAVDVLQGMSPDGTPTIQQRVSLVKRRKVGLWEASIRATRNAQEAWERFQNPPRAGLELGLAEYTAMFGKLMLREADEHTTALPGDKALNFPTPQEANLTEFEKARIRPPSTSQLYEKMLKNGIRPSGSCLAILLANTESMEMARRYLRDSDGTGALYRLLSQEMDVEALKKVPLSLVSAYIQVMTRQGGRRGRKYLVRAIELAEQRLGPVQSPWSDFIWGTILKDLSQHHRGLKILPYQQLKLSLHVVHKLDGACGIPLPAFVQFSKTTRKIIKRELEQLCSEMESSPSTVKNNALWALYDTKSIHKDAMHWDTFGGRPGALDLFRLFRSSALQMKGLFDKLVSLEGESRRLLGATRVAPLDEMMWRRDPARAEHAYEYMISLAYLGEFQQMAKLLEWLITKWGQPEVVQALSELDEVPPYADFARTLCAFRLVAEPMLGQGVVASLREAIDAAGLDWAWPDEEAVEAYVETQEDDSIQALARVLERVRLSWTNTRDDAEREAELDTEPAGMEGGVFKKGLELTFEV
ncbi:hypothetical protein M419DRAFT_24651 [Trichoderma reesei RUT C-30]|uniref:Prefoldin subunit n=1 Tax=Hypocrea jecorina (strain ATCC 56765 / BCRC 32924 / NRRL 11460 / Rut C-30) TaxID=1344414 RepID=A0A024SCX0_HYPJR|nr:hypothetical protein M419DRAFT_24651 [Trichoderma reesei RUT C-30]